MSIVQNIKRLRNEMVAIQANFIPNRHKFESLTYVSKSDGYTASVCGNYGNYHLKVRDDDKKEVILTITRSSYNSLDHSIMRCNGNVTLVGKNPIRHEHEWKVFFNSRMTKEKYFQYAIQHNMPTYEHTLAVIEMKKLLQGAHVNYDIFLNRIDIAKIELCNLDVLNFTKKWKNDSPF